MNKAFKAIIIVLVIGLVCSLCALIYNSYDYYLRHYYRTLEYKDYNSEVIEYLEPYENEPSVEELIALINAQTNTNYPLLCDTTFTGGHTNIQSHKIYMNPEIKRYQYAWIYTHEIFHNTFYTTNERFVEFETFKFLFDNENDYLRYSALNWLKNFNTDSVEYDIRYYAYGYLKEKGYNIKGEE